MAQDFCNSYERAYHSSVPPPVNRCLRLLITSMISDGARPLDLGLRKDAWRIRVMNAYVKNPHRLAYYADHSHSIMDSRLVFIAHSFVDSHCEVEHTFIDHTHLTTGRYHRPAKHDHEAYSSRFILQDGDYMLILLDDDIPSILNVFYKRESTVDILHNGALFIQSSIVLVKVSMAFVEATGALLISYSRLQCQTQCEASKLPLYLLADLEAAAPSLSFILILLLLLVPQLSALDGTEVTTTLETDESNETLDPESLVRLRVLGLLSRRITTKALEEGQAKDF
ncbi:hypothetical protein EDD85DRAFT_791969 [Armillaria nabsnona]|nr:hypothetical protein EDD85DRAFT_791969 [Armillaria nabsnona]